MLSYLKLNIEKYPILKNEKYDDILQGIESYVLAEQLAGNNIELSVEEYLIFYKITVRDLEKISKDSFEIIMPIGVDDDIKFRIQLWKHRFLRREHIREQLKANGFEGRCYLSDGVLSIEYSIVIKNSEEMLNVISLFKGFKNDY